MRSLMLLLVSSDSILFQHLFFLILEHRIEEPDAVAGKFRLNSIPAFVLFDTGASHSFISKSFVDRNGFSTENIGCPIKVSSPGGDNDSKSWMP